MTKTIHELENICKKYSNFQIKNGSKTKGNHSKCLIIDNQYIAVTSYNWLSSGINVKNREKIDINIIKYLNRLSDALFVFSRWSNYKLLVKETLWNPNQK